MDRWLEIAATAEGRGRLFRNPEFGGIIIRFASDDACIAHQLDAMDFDGHLTCSDLERDLLVSATTDDQRQDRLFARWAVCCSRWFIHPRRCLYPRGQHGGRLLHGACAERFLPTAQRRGVGNRLLLRLPLFLVRRWASGASIDCANPHAHPPYRRARPEHSSGRPWLPDSRSPFRSLVAFCPALVGSETASAATGPPSNHLNLSAADEYVDDRRRRCLG